MGVAQEQRYIDSLTSAAILETLDLFGIIDTLKEQMYTIDVKGIVNGEGVVDDPYLHEIRIEKVEKIGGSEGKYILGDSIEVDADNPIEALERFRGRDIEFGVTNGVRRDEDREIIINGAGTWYRHYLRIEVEGKGMTEEDYVRDIFEVLADILKLE